MLNNYLDKSDDACRDTALEIYMMLKWMHAEGIQRCIQKWLEGNSWCWNEKKSHVVK